MSLVLTATARSRVPGRCFRPLELVIQRGLPLESIVYVWMCVREGREKEEQTKGERGCERK